MQGPYKIGSASSSTPASMFITQKHTLFYYSKLGGGVWGIHDFSLLMFYCLLQFGHSVVSDSFVTPGTAARQASLSITNSRSLLKVMSIKLVMPSSHLILCHPFLLRLQPFPAPGSFQMSQFFASGGQSIGASASVLAMNIQD